MGLRDVLQDGRAMPLSQGADGLDGGGATVQVHGNDSLHWCPRALQHALEVGGVHGEGRRIDVDQDRRCASDLDGGDCRDSGV